MSGIDEQIDAYLDGSADAATRDAVAAWIVASDAHAERFLLRAAVHAATRAALQDAAETGRRTTDAASVADRRVRTRFSAWAIAAVLLAAAGAAAVYVASLGSPADSPAPHPVLATVTDTDAVAWRTDPLSAGDDVVGSAVAIDDGAVELTMRGGGDVRLVGPTELLLIGGSRVHLARGTIDVRSEPGFTVTLSRGVEVVDLGTEFTVNAYADGRSSVSVRQGRVRVRDAAGEQHTLAAGLMAAIDDAGRLVVARRGGPFDADPRLVALYRFTGDDERAGTLTNHAIGRGGRFAGMLGDGVNPATAPSWTDGPTAGGRAVRIASAASQQVRVADFAEAGIDEGLTIAAWIRLDRATPWQLIAAQWDIAPARNGFIHLSVHNGRLALHWMEDDRPLPAPGAVRVLVAGEAGAISPADGWVHVAMSLRAGGDIVLYRNGVQVARGRYGTDRLPAAAASPLIFGRKLRDDGVGFDGSIGPIAVFKADLSPSDVARLYASDSTVDPIRASDAEIENETP